MIQIKELVVTDLSRKGSGQNKLGPVRSVFEVYSKEGQLLAINDNLGNYSIEDLVEFGEFCILKKDLSIEEIFELWKS